MSDEFVLHLGANLKERLKQLPPAKPEERIPRGQMKAVRETLTTARIGNKCFPRRRFEVTQAEQIDIARGLLRLQAKKRYVVRIEADFIRIAPYTLTEPVYRHITWRDAAELILQEEGHG